jgi:hypothetical protein
MAGRARNFNRAVEWGWDVDPDGIGEKVVRPE